MNPTSRRGFLALAGAGAATVSVAAVTASPAAAAPAAAPAETALPANAPDALVAHVKDIRRGTLTVMVAGRSVEVTDKDLVARLAHAAKA